MKKQVAVLFALFTSFSLVACDDQVANEIGTEEDVSMEVNEDTSQEVFIDASPSEDTSTGNEDTSSTGDSSQADLNDVQQPLCEQQLTREDLQLMIFEHWNFHEELKDHLEVCETQPGQSEYEVAKSCCELWGCALLESDLPPESLLSKSQALSHLFTIYRVFEGPVFTEPVDWPFDDVEFDEHFFPHWVNAQQLLTTFQNLGLLDEEVEARRFGPEDIACQDWAEHLIFEDSNGNSLENILEFFPFDEERLITRAELASALYSTLDPSCPEGGGHFYDDVGPEHWAFEAIGCTAGSGYFSTTVTLFHPDEPVMRSGALKIFILAHWSNQDLTAGGYFDYLDVKASDWFEVYVNFSNRVTLGKVRLIARPYDLMTREYLEYILSVLQD